MEQEGHCEAETEVWSFFAFLKGSSISVGPPDGLVEVLERVVPLDILGDWTPEQFLATGIPSPPSTDWIFLS